MNRVDSNTLVAFMTFTYDITNTKAAEPSQLTTSIKVPAAQLISPTVKKDTALRIAAQWGGVRWQVKFFGTLHVHDVADDRNISRYSSPNIYSLTMSLTLHPRVDCGFLDPADQGRNFEFCYG
jgi:hypothetical protein